MKKLINQTYAEATRERYRFYSFWVRDGLSIVS